MRSMPCIEAAAVQPTTQSSQCLSGLWARSCHSPTARTQYSAWPGRSRASSARVLADNIVARLLTFSNVLTTCRLGAFTREAVGSIARATTQNVRHLFEGEHSVTELMERVGLSQSALSQQLAKLRAMKLVQTRRDGRTIYYRLASGDIEKVLETLYSIYCEPGANS